MIFIFFVFFANLWIYRIFRSNFVLGVLLFVCSLGLFYFLTSHKRKFLRLFFLVFVPIILIQITSTKKESLISLSNDDRRVVDLRLRAYPPNLVRIGHWFEERPESVALSRISRNLFENLDPNFYFFANHPRERVGVKEFEKFPYIFVPAFVLGVMLSALKQKAVFWGVSFLVPLFLISIVGNANALGPFSLFPFLVVSISAGLKKVFDHKAIPRGLLVCGGIAFILIFIQILSYEIF